MKIKGAIFDFDGTLGDSLGYWEWQYADLSQKYNGGKKVELAPEDDKKFRTSLISDSMKLLHEKYGIGESADSLLKYVNDSIKKFYLTEVKPKEGVVEYLDYLQSKGVKMCVASATAEAELKVAIKCCGLEKYFDKVFSCSELGFGKEKPDIFLMALDYLGTDINDTWVFEDSLLALETAQKAGFKTVGIFDKNNPYTEEQIAKFSTLLIGEAKTLSRLIEL
ncbi:MAG: HAD family phosphatase [Ruminococcaceae bacterium]|nr:HAD family phosphatase [Oscillospiraceae bacterium]